MLYLYIIYQAVGYGTVKNLMICSSF